MVLIVVSLRVDHVIFLNSFRTCRTNCAGVVFAIFCLTYYLVGNSQYTISNNLQQFMQVFFLSPQKKTAHNMSRLFFILAGALGFEPRAYGFGDRRSTN